jgi:integrase
VSIKPLDPQSVDQAARSVFRYTKGRWLYRLLDKASEASGVTIPDGIAFHIFRHSYAAWMRRHAGLDTSGLVATGAWKSPDAARVYEHVEFSEEAAKAALLPTKSVCKA